MDFVEIVLNNNQHLTVFLLSPMLQMEKMSGMMRSGNGKVRKRKKLQKLSQTESIKKIQMTNPILHRQKSFKMASI